MPSLRDGELASFIVDRQITRRRVRRDGPDDTHGLHSRLLEKGSAKGILTLIACLTEREILGCIGYVRVVAIDVEVETGIR